jgi:hypothetical protein
VGSQAGQDNLTKEISGGAAAGPAPMVADPKTGADILAKISDALVTLGNAGVIDGQFAQEVVARLFAMFGIAVDVEAMRARLEEEADAEEEMAAAGGGETDPLADLELEDELTLEALREAFDEAKVKRGPGGKFAEKPGVTDEYSPASADLRAQIEKILGEKAKKGKGAAKGKAKAAPKPKGGKGKAQKVKPMAKAALSQSLKQLKQGASVTVTLANGSVIKGTVDRAAGGVAIVQTAKGAVILHGGLKNVAKIEG